MRALTLVKLAKFESDASKASKESLKLQDVTDLCMGDREGRGGGGGGYRLVPSILHMSVEICDFAELYLFLTNNSQTWQFYYF